MVQPEPMPHPTNLPSNTLKHLSPHYKTISTTIFPQDSDDGEIPPLEGPCQVYEDKSFTANPKKMALFIQTAPRVTKAPVFSGSCTCEQKLLFLPFLK